MSKLSDKIAEMDSKVNPETGNKLRVTFKTITLILVLVCLPLIAAIGGSWAVIGATPSWTIYVAFFPWLVLVLIFSILWFYYSKWTKE